MKRTKIHKLLQSEASQDNVLIKGWVRTRRDSKAFSFLEINDGSCLKNIQVIADESLPNYEGIKKLTTGSAVTVRGKLVQSRGGGRQRHRHPGRRSAGAGRRDLYRRRNR